MSFVIGPHIYVSMEPKRSLSRSGKGQKRPSFFSLFAHMCMGQERMEYDSNNPLRHPSCIIECQIRPAGDQKPKTCSMFVPEVLFALSHFGIHGDLGWGNVRERIKIAFQLGASYERYEGWGSSVIEIVLESVACLIEGRFFLVPPKVMHLHFLNPDDFDISSRTFRKFCKTIPSQKTTMSQNPNGPFESPNPQTGIREPIRRWSSFSWVSRALFLPCPVELQEVCEVGRKASALPSDRAVARYKTEWT